MIEQSNSLVLEILRLEGNLKMSLFEQKELNPTIRHYSQCPISLAEIHRLSDEIIQVLNQANKKGILVSELVNNLKKNGQLLYDQLLSRAVKERLRASSLKNLVLSLDEELIDIPWELLYDGKDFFSLQFNLGRLVKTREKTSQSTYRELSGFLKMLIMVNPTNDLEAAYFEGLHIKNQLDKKRNQISIDFKSTHIDTMYVKKNLRDYDIVHFAGHCEHDSENPKDSGWVFNNGKLTVQDIISLGDSLSMPTLVFSNACQSANLCSELIDSQYQNRTYNVASAFLFSGVRHYIGTTRKIEDTVSIVFAKEFYNQLIKGNSVGESVRLGRLKLIDDFGIDSIFWTGYLLYGDPNFILFPNVKKPVPAEKKEKKMLSRKLVVKLFAAALLILTAIILYAWLPALNPSSYFLLLKSRRLLSQGKNQEAVLLSLKLVKRQPLFLEAYPQIGEALQRLGKREEALNHYFDYALYSQKKNDKSNLSKAYISIAWLYQQMGDYRKAKDFYNKAITLSRDSKDKLHEAEAIRKLAVWHMDKDENDMALELLTKSSEINRERQKNPAHKYSLACDYFDLGLLFSNKEDYTTAKDFYGKSLKIFQEMKLDKEVSDYYFNLGEIYLLEKDYNKALDSYQKGLAIDKHHDNKTSLSSDYTMIGELYMEMDNLEKAEEYFKQSLVISEGIKAAPESAEANYNLGLLSKKRNQKNKAREYFRRAQEFYRHLELPNYQSIKKELLELDGSA